MSERLRVLILADDCNPDWPSLPVVGYKAARAIADHASVTVATHVRNRPQIDRDGMGKAEVVFLDNEYIARPMFKLGRFLRGGNQVGWTTNIAISYPSYLAFEYEAWKRFKKPLRSGEFDVVHRLTPMSPTIPSPMAKWSPIPFVLGPLNGGLKWPAAFDGERKREKEWLVKVRNAYRLLPYYRSTYRDSRVVLAAFAHTIADLPAHVRERCIDFPEVGIDPELFVSDVKRGTPESLSVVLAGRLVADKLPTVAIEVFARSEKLRRHRLVVVGDGPERPAMEARIAAAGLQDCVQMLGWKTQAEVGRWMADADVFVFPSIRELGAGVVAEAMASGMCVLGIDYGGPAGLIADDRGIKVPLGSPAEITDAFVRRMEELVDDPVRVRHLGDAARAYALRHLTWDVKARKTIEVYRWALGQRIDKPMFDIDVSAT
jgi:glycosyltransferase involved in cell wall biosynthesis